MNLLTVGNPKVEKGAKFGYLNALLHLAPAKLAKRQNICPHASAGCLRACLNTAGRGGMFKTGTNTNKIQEARIRKTQLLFDDPAKFAAMLFSDMESLTKKADREGLTPALRLNGTSDIDWSEVGFGKDIFEVVEDLDIELYDYTKDVNKALKYIGYINYHLTFSRSESNEEDCLKVLQKGGNVAVVFHKLPPTWNGYRVIDGDQHDLRFLDPKNVIVGLKAKGKAKKDTTGFVV